jgi:hypothetical protein
VFVLRLLAWVRGLCADGSRLDRGFAACRSVRPCSCRALGGGGSSMRAWQVEERWWPWKNEGGEQVRSVGRGRQGRAGQSRAAEAQAPGQSDGSEDGSAASV